MWKVRHEKSEDWAEISELTRRAFEPMEYSNGDEQEMINALRSSGRLALSLVVEYRGSLVGHVAFSKGVCVSSPTDWYALGPISVEPKFQKRGIGTALIEAGLSQLKSIRSLRCVLVGDPNYYQRFGFVLAPKFSPPRQPAEYFMMQMFGKDEAPSGLDFDPAFYDPSSGL